MNEDTVLVEYVGLKDSEVDHLYGTGIVWTGRGNVQSVPSPAWQQMKKHNDVWREAAPPAAIQVSQPPPAEPKEPTPGPTLAPTAAPAQAKKSGLKR